MNKVYLIYSDKGGVGKSTFSTIFLELARLNKLPFFAYCLDEKNRSFKVPTIFQSDDPFTGVMPLSISTPQEKQKFFNKLSKHRNKGDFISHTTILVLIVYFFEIIVIGTNRGTIRRNNRKHILRIYISNWYYGDLFTDGLGNISNSEERKKLDFNKTD